MKYALINKLCKVTQKEFIKKLLDSFGESFFKEFSPASPASLFRVQIRRVCVRQLPFHKTPPFLVQFNFFLYIHLRMNLKQLKFIHDEKEFISNLFSYSLLLFAGKRSKSR
jgi:hypothetical protein